MIRAALISLCLAALLPAGAQALDYRVVGDVAYITGEVFRADLRKFKRMMRRNPDVAMLVLLDVPGSADDATNVQIIRLIRQMGLRTHLTAQSHVASGGTDLFLGGLRRTMEPGARIGVHSWSDGRRDGAAFPRDSGEHDLLLDLYADIGIPEAFYWFTLEAAPAEGMHYMSAAEIRRFGLVTR